MKISYGEKDIWWRDFVRVHSKSAILLLTSQRCLAQGSTLDINRWTEFPRSYNSIEMEIYVPRSFSHIFDIKMEDIAVLRMGIVIRSTGRLVWLSMNEKREYEAWRNHSSEFFLSESRIHQKKDSDGQKKWGKREDDEHGNVRKDRWRRIKEI